MVTEFESASDFSSKPDYYSEQAFPGRNMFNEGSELKHSLIDISKAYDYVNTVKESNNPVKKPAVNADLYISKNVVTREYNADSIDMVPSNQIVKRQSQGQKWSRILEYMKRNPKVLMESIPSPRAGEKMKEILAPPSSKSINENFNKKLGKQKMPSFAASGLHRRRSETEKDQSVASSHISKHTSKSMLGRHNQNVNKMVVMKPVPFASKGSSIKKFRFEGKIVSLTPIEKSSEKVKPRLHNPFKRMTAAEMEQEKSLYSDMWDEVASKDKQIEPTKKLDFYEVNRTDLDAKTSENALELTNAYGFKSDNLRDQTDKLFKIAKNVSQPKFVDWKHSVIYEQYKSNSMTNFGHGEFDKLYKESDIIYIIDMVNRQKQDVAEAKIIGPIHKKGLMTLDQLMLDLDMHFSYKKIASKYREVTVNNTLRILIRCRMYFSARGEIIKMIQSIDKREE
jgi:hypothetical protein